MRLTTDHIFHIGGQHLRNGKPCEDYALSGALDGAAYAIVSDGCSSGDKTDIGSRIVALAARQAITRVWSKDRSLEVEADIGIFQGQQILEAQSLLGLSLEDMLATSVYALAVPGIGALTSLQGDGVVATAALDGAMTMYRYDWSGNAPFYPAYRHENRTAFIAHHGGDVNALAVSWSAWHGDGGDSFCESASGTMSLLDGISGITLRITAEELANLRFIAVFTDGVTQISDMPWQRAVCELLSFKSTEGSFAKRRMNRFLRDIRTQGNEPLDDISYAVIQLESETMEA